jgi:hypothetical protein
MTRVRTGVSLVFVAALATALAAQTAQKEKPAAKAPAKHAPVTSADLKWGPAPPSLPPGAEAAVVDGDPTKPGPFVMREVPRRLSRRATLASHRRKSDRHLRFVCRRHGRQVRRRIDERARPRRLRPNAEADASLRHGQGSHNHPDSRDGPLCDHLRQSGGRSSKEDNREQIARLLAD